MSLLPYITDEELKSFTEKVLQKTTVAYRDSEDKISSNVIDPFSALFDSVRQNISINEWYEQEKARQIQKTLQNAIGEFHQDVLESVPGWSNPGRGGGYDVISHEHKIIAELKNKFNTLNSSSAESTFRKLSKYIDEQYQGYVGYVVFIVPKQVHDYDTPWSPNHNTMPLRNDIRKIDGESFYKLVTGYDDALEMLFDRLLKLVSETLNYKVLSVADQAAFKQLFKTAYK